MRGLTDRIVVVAGAATGIGAATARRLAEEGSKVVVGDLNADGAEQTARSIESAGGTAIAVQYDQADESSIAKLIAQSVDHFGSLHGLHANAADLSDELHGRQDGDLMNMQVAAWDRTLRVNLTGYAILLREALPHLLSAGGGAIVCTSSDGTASGGMVAPAYNAAKAGVNTMIRSVANRWGKDGIRCNAISPGRIWTESMDRLAGNNGIDRARLEATCPSPRLGRAEDIAGLVAFLLSDDGEFVNGQVWSVNGGALLRE